jgi:DNA repair protein RadC
MAVLTMTDQHNHGHRQRLRERFIRSGFEGFNDYEIVELLLTLAIPRSDVKQPAKALIARFGNLRSDVNSGHQSIHATSCSA